MTLLVASACGGRSSDSANTSDDGSAVLPIQVDGSNEAKEITLYNYFPDIVVARPGDTLRFGVSTTGEPQTVTCGTLVESA